jgi:Flp pilus assembly protein TadG
MKWFQRGRQRLLQRTEGATAVEFAIILPVFLLFVFGIIDFGNVYFQLYMVNEASREGARVATVGGTLQTVTTTVQNFGSNFQVSMTPSPPVSGQNVTVTVTNSVQIFTPLIRAFFPNNPYTVTGRSVMRVE